MSILKRLFGKSEPKPPLPPKDPADFTLTENSREWTTDQYCPQCKATVGHRERIAEICNSCGYIAKNHADITKYRSYRMIWNGSKWVCQIKYGNDPSQWVIQDRRP